MRTGTVHSHLEMGRIHRENKDYNSAIEELTQAQKLGLDNAEVHLELGRVYRERREFDSAIEEFKKALELDLDNQEIHLELARIFRHNKEYTEAVQEFKSALDKRPADPVIHLELARLYQENQDYTQAIEELNTALRHNPSDGRIYLELGRVYQQKKDYGSAVIEISKAIELGLDNAEAHLELGRTYRKKGEYPQAIEELNTALRHNPSDGRIYLELGRVYQQKKDYGSAVIEISKAIELGIDNAEAHLELGRTYSEQGEYTLAEEECQNALRLNPQSGQCHAELAWLYINAQEYALAEKELQEAIKKGFNEDDARQISDRIHYSQRVIEEFKKAMESEPEDGNPLGCITEYIFQEGYKSFIKKLEEIVKANPKNLRAHIELTWIYGWHKQYALVLQKLKKISEITPQNKKIHIELARIYHCNKDYDSAIKEFEKVLQAYSNSNNQDDNLKREFIVTLKDLFPGREEEIEDLIKDPSIYSLRKWRYPVTTKAEGEILYLITRLLKPEVIIEAGTWMGTSTTYLAKGCCDNKKGKVITIDKGEDIGYAIPVELLPYIEFHKGVDVKDELPVICNKETRVDMFFHDSGNSCELILWEIEKVLPLFSKGGLIIAHDALNYTNPPGSNVASFFNEIKERVKCYFFKTEIGLGVINDIEKLKLR